MNKYFLFSLLAVLFSCLSPNEITVSSDGEALALDQLLNSVASHKGGWQMIKKVTLDGKQESNTVPSDSLIIQSDLKAVREYSFARLITTANYRKSKTENGYKYERMEKEKNGPTLIYLQKKDSKISFLNAKFKNENLLYQSQKEIEMTFANSQLSRYRISGSRKLVGMAPSDFLIEVELEKF